jgi:hypothetical protein
VWAVVVLHEEFDPEFALFAAAVQDELLAHGKLLAQFGPTLGRPRVDTLEGSRHANMKELRFAAAGGVWRVAFAFDPARRAPCGGRQEGQGRAPVLQSVDQESRRSRRFMAREGEGQWQ